MELREEIKNWWAGYRHLLGSSSGFAGHLDKGTGNLEAGRADASQLSGLREETKRWWMQHRPFMDVFGALPGSSCHEVKGSGTARPRRGSGSGTSPRAAVSRGGVRSEPVPA